MKARGGLQSRAHDKELVPTSSRKLEFASSNSHCHEGPVQPVRASLETSRFCLFPLWRQAPVCSGSCLRSGCLLIVFRAEAAARLGEEWAVLWLQPRHEVWLGNKGGLKGSLKGGLAKAVTSARFLRGRPGKGLGKAGERGSRRSCNISSSFSFLPSRQFLVLDSKIL